MGWLHFSLVEQAKLLLQLHDKFQLSLRMTRLHMHALPFQPGLTLHFDNMDFFNGIYSLCAQAKNSSPVSKTGLGFSAPAEIQPFLKAPPCTVEPR